MAKTIAYISGAITGLNEHRVSEIFDNTIRKFQNDFDAFINPLEIGKILEVNGYRPSWEEYMCEDLKYLLNATHVIAISNWETSKGATLELIIAQKLGKKIINDDGTEFKTVFEIKKH